MQNISYKDDTKKILTIDGVEFNIEEYSTYESRHIKIKEQTYYLIEDQQEIQTKIAKKGYLDFDNTIFMIEANFETKQFTKNASFKYCQFSEGANFTQSIFKEDVTFEDSKFHKIANFENATFEKEADFKSATFKEKAYFNSSTFNKNAIFSLTTFEKEFAFNGVNKQEQNDFILDLKLSDIEIMDYTDSNINKADNRETFLTLKNFALKNNDQVKALEFHTKEMNKHYDTLRWQNNLIDKFLLFFEKKVSHFGTNPLYPILWLIYILFLSATAIIVSF